MRYNVIAIFILMFIIATSGCIGEKTVIKSNITITGDEENPVIEDIRVTIEKVSRTNDYMQATTHFPGVSMKCINNMMQIDYWRSVDYHGAGEYEIISELRELPKKGDRVDVIIQVADINADQLAKKTRTIEWE